ncbi:MAG: ParM/StbA family protein [Nanopusillaceae archaeon]
MNESLLFNKLNTELNENIAQDQLECAKLGNEEIKFTQEVDNAEPTQNAFVTKKQDSSPELVNYSHKQPKAKSTKEKKLHDDEYAGFKIFKWRNFLGIDENITYDFAILDPGYGNVKIAKVSMIEKRIDCFIAPSVVSEIPEWQVETFDGVGQSSSVEYKGKKYIAGIPALTFGFRKPTLLENWIEEYGCPIYALSFCNDVKEIIITLSLADWNKRKKISENLKEIGFDNVTFAAQGLGIWFQANAPEHAVVNDIGFNTVDVLIINHKKVLRELCFSIKEFGLISFLEKLTKGDPYILAMKLEQGDPELTKKVKDHYFQWLEEQMSVRSEWRRVLDSNVLVGNFIIGGGGARFFPKKYRSYVTIPKDPEFANVEGLAKYFISLKLKS